MSSNEIGSMADLLASVMADNEKTAEDVNPPTKGPGSGKPDNQEAVTEGERSAEHDAHIQDHLGATGAVGAPSPDANKADYNQHMRAAKLTPTGEDPEHENSREGAPVEAEPGTSKSELKLSEQADQWTENATQLLVDLAVDQKLAGDTHNSSPAEKAPNVSTEYDDPCVALAGGDEKLAGEIRFQLQSQLVDSLQFGNKLADDTIDYLHNFSQWQEAEASKTAMGMAAMPPEAGAMPPEMAAMPPEAGAMPPEMVEEGTSPEEEQVLEEAIMELAAEMGVSPEELVAMLQAEAAGEGGDLGAAAGPPEASAAAMPPEGGEVEEKDVVASLKMAAAKHHVKKEALTLLLENIHRGKR